MNKIFLTSQASLVLDQIVKDMVCEPNTMTVCFVTTAANPYQNKSFVDRDRNALINLGFHVKDVDVEGSNVTALQESIKDCNIIFVAGGNTFYLLEKVKSSGFDQVIHTFLADGGIYIGSSAGSVIMGTSIDIVSRMDNKSAAPGLQDTDGLCFVNKLVLPHADNSKYRDQITKTLSDYQSEKENILLINDSEYYSF